MYFILNIRQLVLTSSTLLLFLIHTTTAQPRIDVSITPTIGETWQTEYLEAPGFDPGATGANVSWDFSHLTSELSLEYKIIAPSAAPAFDSFPEADFVWELSGFQQYNFYESNNDGIILHGGVNGSPGDINFMTKYIDLEDAFRFPITYETTYSYYSSFNNYLFGNFLNSADRTGQVTADAYGTLTTPFGTYQDVLRIKIESISQGESSTVYSWWDVNEFTPILQYEESSDATETPYAVFTKKIISATQSINKLKPESMTVFLDGNNTYIKLHNARKFSNLQLHCFDINGRIMFKEELVHADSPKTPILLSTNMGQFSSGQYFLRLMNSDFIATGSIIIN